MHFFPFTVNIMHLFYSTHPLRIPNKRHTTRGRAGRGGVQCHTSAELVRCETKGLVSRDEGGGSEVMLGSKF
jgi:hypothetical protein